MQYSLRDLMSSESISFLEPAVQNQNRNLLIVALVITLCCGCGTSTAPRAAAKRDVFGDVAVWDSPEKTNPVPGIDYAAVTYYLWNDRVVFALWADTDNNDGERLFSGDRLHGHIAFRDRRPAVKFDCNTPDGKSGSLTVHDQQFDLSEGSLILVSTSGGTVRLKQLKREGMAAILPNGTREGFQKLKTDPEIAKFFAK